MRIRHLVCTDNFAGVERYVATTASELVRRGHDVEVFGGNAEAMHAALDPSMVRFVDTPSPRAALLPMVQGPRPDLVHAHMTGSDAVAVATRAMVRAPVVSTLHFARRRGHDALTRALYSLIPHLVTVEVAISEFVASTAQGRPLVIPNGVPIPDRDASGSRDAPGRRDVVLVAQRLESEKATSIALSAFAASGLATKGWELHVAGTGSERSDLERQAENAGIIESTRLLGRVDDLEQRMARVGMFLAPAPAEPFGLSVVEAMAARLPVIAADGGAHRETIGSATPETLFTPGDITAAAELLRRYGNDPAARIDLGTRGRARAVRAFAIETHVDRLEKLYDRTLARRRHRRADR